MRKVDMDAFSRAPERYELREGTADGAPDCPYGNKFEWIGYDLKKKEYVRFTKSVFKIFIQGKNDGKQ